MKHSYVAGDLVVINSDDSVVYTITSLYGNDQNAMCTFTDSKSGLVQELSIPVVALTRHTPKNATAAPAQAIPNIMPSPSNFASFLL